LSHLTVAIKATGVSRWGGSPSWLNLTP
jgi:hypothetical protein